VFLEYVDDRASGIVIPPKVVRVICDSMIHDGPIAHVGASLGLRIERRGNRAGFCVKRANGEGGHREVYFPFYGIGA